MISYRHYICAQCNTDFSVSLKNDNAAIRRGLKNRFCSRNCSQAHNKQHLTTSKEVSCKECGKKFIRPPNQIRKTINTFCSLSCAAKYNNTHKKHGTRRSRLERWLEYQLKEKYSTLAILFNKKDAINSELDIYIPSLKLAFELNGIYHYEPIHGPEKLTSIQNNDRRKFQACLEKQIELCIIDVSRFHYFKVTKAQEYLDIILTIINQKLEISRS